MKCRNERRQFSYSVAWRHVKLWDVYGDLCSEGTLSEKLLRVCVWEIRKSDESDGDVALSVAEVWRWSSGRRGWPLHLFTTAAAPIHAICRQVTSTPSPCGTWCRDSSSCCCLQASWGQMCCWWLLSTVADTLSTSTRRWGAPLSWGFVIIILINIFVIITYLLPAAEAFLRS